MIRVIIKWDTKFKLFRRVKGFVEVQDVQFTRERQIIHEIMSAGVFAEEGTIGYENIKIRGKRYASFFEKIKPHIDLALRSYLEGFKMADSSVFWCSRKGDIDKQDNTSVIVI